MNQQDIRDTFGALDQQMAKVIEQRDLWAKQCNYATEREAVTLGERNDLAMLVRRMIKYAPTPLADHARDYLKRKGLEGSPLRDSTPDGEGKA